MSSLSELSYTPVWNVPKNYLTGFIARVPTSQAIGNGDEFVKAQADRDIALLVQSSNELTGMVDKGNKLVLIVPVSLSTLDRAPYRTQYLEFCRSIAPEVRSLMVLKIEQIAPDLPHYRLQEILREPSTLLRSLIVTVDIRQREFDVLAGCRIHAYNVTLCDAPVSEVKSFALLDRFAEMIQKINHAAMVEDIPSRALLGACIGAGIAYVSGPAVQSPQKTLDVIRPFDLAEVYKDILGE